MQRIGLGAAWPRPQMEASPITSASSSRVSESQCSASMSRAALAVPTRQGVHWPQLSSARKRITFSAASRARSCWLSTMTAAEPMKHP
jgi:hypothetical protein